MANLNSVNHGVYTNAQHDLWLGEAEPSVEDIRSGAAIKPGEVVVAIQCTGICG